MSEATDRAGQYLDMAKTAVVAMEVIGQATKSLVSKGDAASLDEVTSVLAAIAAVCDGISRGLANRDTVTKDATDKALQDLRDGIAENNAAIRARVDARFPKE